MVVFAVAINVGFKPFAQGVDHADAHAVQAAGDFVAVLVELATGVQLCEHDLKGADLRILVHRDGNAPAVVLYRAASVGADTHGDAVTGPRQSFVD